MYIAATPLEGMERVDSLLEALGRSAQKLAALHTMTIIEDNVDEEADAKVSKPPFCSTVKNRLPMEGSAFFSHMSVVHVIYVMHRAADIHSL